MNPQTFFDHFERLTDAPQSITRLRELILQLAVQGKLVEQDERDEPTERLLERIEAERKRLVREKKIREAKPLPPVSDDEKPFEIPDSWRWVRLSEVGHDWGQKKPDVEFTYIDVAAIDNESGVITGEVKVLQPDEAPSRARKIVKQGTVIYSTVRPYLLNIAIVEKLYELEPIASTAFAIIHPFNGISAKYLFFYLRSQHFITYVEAQMKGIAYPAINDEGLFGGLIPLPPSEAQKRIVAKVDELMRLCDELERAQAERREARQHLNRAVLDQLLAARDAAEFQTRWQTVVDNFPTLTAAPDQIGKLRQTVLQLAVQGKLTRQDLQDEPASALLRRIRAERERLVKEKKLKRADPFLPVNPDEIPSALPSGWTWARLEELLLSLRNGIAIPPSEIGKARILRISALRPNCVNLAEYRFLPDDSPAYKEFQIEAGDLLFTRYSGNRDFVGICSVVPPHEEAFIHPDKLIRGCLIKNGVVPEFIALAINTGASRSFIERLTKTTAGQVGIAGRDLKLVLVPVPPLEEQKRIVATVNRLMSLCNELEAGLRRAEEGSERLLRAAARSLLAPALDNSTRVPTLA